MAAFASSALLLVMAFGSAEPHTAAEIPTYAITGPTVIAFFAPVTDAELEKNPDINEALSDFQLYVSQVAPRMKRAGIHFEVASAVRFRLKNGGVTHTFTPAKTFVGYYLVAPGRRPRVEYGVLDDLSLMEIANQYFRLPGANQMKRRGRPSRPVLAAKVKTCLRTIPFPVGILAQFPALNHSEAGTSTWNH